ncbi:HAD family hydrolase [Gracilibacillus saliphilus]|uniref:HAD family hydrolase n=1 Tax=Gracilibacillus saliphilus TaxID=543890 RepID=UPI0013D4B5B6|nr:HAD family hydrolase [Gracilibacillus saliphilus]
MIFFDIDATLLDHDKAERLAAIDFYKKNSDELASSEKDFVDLWFALSKKYFEKFLSGEVTFQEQRRMRIKDLFGHHLNDQQADNIFNYYVVLYKRNWSAFEDVIPCLKSLKQKGIRLGIISNGDYQQQIEKLENLAIKHYFEHIITSSEIGVAKPNSIIFKKACLLANAQVHKSYYVGDRFETDAIGSKQAGMIGVWLNRISHKTTSSVKVIHSLVELTKIVSER